MRFTRITLGLMLLLALTAINVLPVAAQTGEELPNEYIADDMYYFRYADGWEIGVTDSNDLYAFWEPTDTLVFMNDPVRMAAMGDGVGGSTPEAVLESFVLYFDEELGFDDKTVILLEFDGRAAARYDYDYEFDGTPYAYSLFAIEFSDGTVGLVNASTAGSELIHDDIVMAMVASYDVVAGAEMPSTDNGSETAAGDLPANIPEGGMALDEDTYLTYGGATFVILDGWEMSTTDNNTPYAFYADTDTMIFMFDEQRLSEINVSGATPEEIVESFYYPFDDTILFDPGLVQSITINGRPAARYDYLDNYEGGPIAYSLIALTFSDGSIGLVNANTTGEDLLQEAAVMEMAESFDVYEGDMGASAETAVYTLPSGATFAYPGTWTVADEDGITNVSSMDTGVLVFDYPGLNDIGITTNNPAAVIEQVFAQVESAQPFSAAGVEAFAGGVQGQQYLYTASDADGSFEAIIIAIPFDDGTVGAVYAISMGTSFTELQDVYAIAASMTPATSGGSTGGK